MSCEPCCDNPTCLPVVADVIPKVPVDPCCCVCVPTIQPQVIPIPVVRRRCKYIQPQRPKSFKPDRNYLPPTAKMEECTIYKKSFCPTGGCRPVPIMPENNLCLGEGKISDNTVHRSSFLPHCQKPPEPIVPCSHKLLGVGPMQDLTTAKHDFGPKPICKTDKIVPPSSLYGSDCPLSDKTINRLSFTPKDPCAAKVAPIYPSNQLNKACGKMSCKTVHTLSFQPWELPEQQPTPWAVKPVYQPPVQRMEGDTINRMSYGPPGQYVECAPDDPDCVECPDPCNEQDPNHFRKDPNCRGPCCCPRAGC